MTSQRSIIALHFYIHTFFIAYSFLHLVIENSILEDYVSEKALQALHLGAVPIYLGAPNAAEILPRGSFINLRDYNITQGTFDISALKAVLDRALESPDEYAKYHAWRLPYLDLKFMKLIIRKGNSQTFVMNRMTYGDRKRLTCDLCSYVSTLQQQSRRTRKN
jgi:hypothetical protein